MEINELASELEKLENLFKRGEKLQDGFKALCQSREEQNKDTCLSFSSNPDGICNKLYFDLATRLFNPKNPADLLEILLPSVKQVLVIHLRVDKTLVSESLEGLRQRPIFNTSWLNNDLKTLFKECVIAGDTLFEIPQMCSLNLALHRDLYKKLDAYPEIKEKLYLHNEKLEALNRDIILISDGGPTLKEALILLKEKFTIGGAAFTGDVINASPSAELEARNFMNYFDSFDSEIKARLLAIPEMNELIEELKSRECVETMKETIDKLLTATPPDFLLRPLLSKERSDEIQSKYHPKKPLTPSGIEKNATPPIALSQQLLNHITIQTLEELCILLISIPENNYPIFLNAVRLLKSVTTEIHSIFPILSPEKQKAFLSFLLQSKKPEFRNALIVCFSTIDLEGLTSMILAMPQENLLELLQAKDSNGQTALHYAADNQNPAVIAALIAAIPQENLLELLRVEDIYGWSALQHAASNSNSAVIAAFIAAIPQEHRAELLQATTTDGQTALHHAANNSNPAVIRALIATITACIPQKNLVELLQAKITYRYNNGVTALQHAASNLNPAVIAALIAAMIACIPKEKLLELLQAKDSNGLTALHYAAANPNPAVITAFMAAITAYIPKENLLEIVSGKDNNEETALDMAVRYSNSVIIELLLSILPEVD